jgi:amino acid permease
VLTGLIVGMLIPSNDPALFTSVMSVFRELITLILAQENTQLGSITFRSCVYSSRREKSVHHYLHVSLPERFIYSALPHIVNAVVLISAFSSANGRLYSASRFLFALGVRGQAPKFVTTVSHNGLPYVSIMIGVRQ